MRIAVVSDIHANLPALEAVIAAVGDVDAWWHCGDVVGYGPHPDEVVARLRGLAAVGVMGNHDAAALGSPIVEWFNPDAHRAALWTRDVISAETRAWLAALPETLLHEGRTIVHGSPRSPLEEYVTSPSAAGAALDLVPGTLCVHGHTHVPVAWRVGPTGGAAVGMRPVDGRPIDLAGGRFLLNPGSVGQPRDGDRDASFLVLDTERGTATWRRVAYPIRQTQDAIRKAGLPERLAARLGQGR